VFSGVGLAEGLPLSQPQADSYNERMLFFVPLR